MVRFLVSPAATFAAVALKLALKVVLNTESLAARLMGPEKLLVNPPEPATPLIVAPSRCADPLTRFLRDSVVDALCPWVRRIVPTVAVTTAWSNALAV